MTGGSQVDPHPAIVDEYGNVIDVDHIDTIADDENVYLLKSAVYALWEARSAVVRPTRDQLIEIIEESRDQDDFGLKEGVDGTVYRYVGPVQQINAERAADAVLALFAVAVSDSQETPTEGREE